MFHNKTGVPRAVPKVHRKDKSRPATPVMQETIKEVGKRNLLIQLADKSEAGCLAVDGYLADHLTNDNNEGIKNQKDTGKSCCKKKKKC